ncbi:DNA replication/repair protein RecF [Candidatus Roizmanbacteria bacterium]|nr:DNA replication/repair protein RecF [Candidatus Roizmanbacteria bacterium]
MILNKIHLQHFRNFDDVRFEFHPVLSIIIGENARGKTNILEGVYVAIAGWGFRESREEELVQWNSENAFVASEWIENNERNNFSISFMKRGEKIEKHFFVDKTRKTHLVYSQFQTKAVLFAPEQIEILTGSPERRRDYFNRLISHFDSDYKKKLHNYGHALYKRNKILEHRANTSSLQEELLFWDDYLEKQAAYITQKREEYLTYLNANQKVEDKMFRVEYIKNELTKARLESVFEQEQRLRKTTIGPQKDDFHFFLSDGEEKNIHRFGSRSEQRLTVFWLKLNELRYLEDKFKSKPMLLLDDIFSELDSRNTQLIFDMIGKYQTILTTTEKELLALAHIEKSIINL